jgi:hypothetical protein
MTPGRVNQGGRLNSQTLFDPELYCKVPDIPLGASSCSCLQMRRDRRLPPSGTTERLIGSPYLNFDRTFDKMFVIDLLVPLLAQ